MTSSRYQGLTRRASTEACRTGSAGCRMPVQMLLMKVRTCMLNTAGIATASSLRARAAARGLGGPFPPAPSQIRALLTCGTH